jgi:putative membrane protein
LSDQHLGGAIMLIVGGASYLAGGLWLTALLVRLERASVS